MIDGDDTRTGHPVPEQVRALDAGVGDLLGCSLIGLDAAAARESLIALSRLRARVDALTLQVAVAADEVRVGEKSGAVSTGAWWACATQQVRRSANTQVTLGHAVEERWRRVGAAAAAGAANLDQVGVIVHALDELPDDLPADLVCQAEEHLVDLARAHDAKTLRILGRAILEHLAPQIAEDHERKRLEAEEARARQKMRLTLSSDGHGSVHGRFTIPEAQGAMFEKALWALASPRHRAAVENKDCGEDEKSGSWVGRPAPDKLGAAFCELIETLSAKDLPKAGKMDATVLVTVSLATLQQGLGTATLDTGERITASQVRRLACEAKIIPVVLNGDSVPLDLARFQRLHTSYMHQGAVVRDGGCTAEGCDWPPGMCHLHHKTPWSKGGGTSLENSCLLCPHHHHRIHDPAYDATFLANGTVRFHRRT